MIFVTLNEIHGEGRLRARFVAFDSMTLSAFVVVVVRIPILVRTICGFPFLESLAFLRRNRTIPGSSAEIPLANVTGPVTPVSENITTRFDAGLQGQIVSNATVFERKQPREQRSPRRHAKRAVANAVRKTETVGCQGVQVGRRDVRVAVASEIGPAVLVGENEKEIWPAG